MYLHSKWLASEASSAWLTSFANRIGKHTEGETIDSSGRIIRRISPYTDREETDWNESETHGERVIGVAQLQVGRTSDWKLLGIITSSVALTEHLTGQMREQLRRDQVHLDQINFPLDGLLDPELLVSQIWPTSVRIAEGDSRTLLQTEKGENLHSMLAGLHGRPVGVTLRSEYGQATVVDQTGVIIFTDTTTPSEVLQIMHFIQQSVPLRLPELA